jgi:hypothetical protein
MEVRIYHLTLAVAEPRTQLCMSKTKAKEIITHHLSSIIHHSKSELKKNLWK